MKLFNKDQMLLLKVGGVVSCVIMAIMDGLILTGNKDVVIPLLYPLSMNFLVVGVLIIDSRTRRRKQ